MPFGILSTPNHRTIRPFSLVHLAGRLAVFAMMALGSLSGWAQTTYYWTNNLAGNASGSWNNASNWRLNAIGAGVNNIASFTNSISALSTITLDADQTIGTLSVAGAGSADWVFNAGSPDGRLILSANAPNGVITVSARTATINAVVDGYQGLLKNGAGSLVLSANNTFTGSFTNAAGGTTTLSGNNAYQDGTYLTGGTLSISSDANVGGAATPINFYGGALQITGTALNNLDSHTVNWTGFNGTLDINNAANTFSINSPLTGNGGLTKNGAGVLVLNTPDYRTGNTTINAGKLVLSASSATLATTTLTINNGSVFDPSALGCTYALAANQTVAGKGGINADVSLAAGAKIIPGGANATGVLSISNSLTLGGQAITFDLATNNVVTSDLIAVGGQVTLNSNLVVVLNYITALTNGTYTVLTGASLSLNGNTVLFDKSYRNVTLNVGAASIAVVVGPGGTGSKSLTWVGDGANNVWDKGVTANWSDGTGTNTYFDPDTVSFTDTGSATPAINLTASVMPGSVTFNHSTKSYTLGGAGSISGTTALTKQGTGTLTVANANTYSGNTTLSAGTLALSSGNNRLPVTSTLVAQNNSSFNLGGNSQTLANYTYTTYTSIQTNTLSYGSLTLNGTGDVGMGGTTASTTNVVDMRLLGSLVVSKNNNFNFGPTGYRIASQGSQFYGPTNLNITVNTVQIGQAAGPDALHKVYFEMGQTNVFNATTMYLANNPQNDVTMLFRAGLVKPTLTLRDKTGTGRMNLFQMHVNWAGGGDPNARLDTTGGTLDALINNAWLGVSTANARPMTSYIKFNNGTLDVTDLRLGYATATGAGNPIRSYIYQNGGVARIGTLEFGYNDGTLIPLFQAAYNLNGGTLQVQSAIQGSGTAQAGSTRFINWTNGVISDYESNSACSISSPVVISAPGVGNRFFTVGSGSTLTVDSVINAGAATATPVTKDGPGILVLTGSANNPFLGLVVSNGTVQFMKSFGQAVNSSLSLNGGTAQLASPDQIADALPVVFGGGTLDLYNNAETVAGLSGGPGSVIDSAGWGSGVLTVNTTGSTNYSYAGSLGSGGSGNGFALVKAGLGKQTLCGTDTHTGGTIVNAGILEVGNGGATGNISGDIAVAAGGTLAFNRSGTLSFSEIGRAHV